MKNTFSLCLWRCTLAMGLIACHKDHNTPTPTPTVTPILGKMTINTSYPDSSKTLSNVELIITEPGGKPLLDLKNVTLMGFGIGCLVALGVACVMTRDTVGQSMQETRRLVDALSWAAVLPQMLGMLGLVFSDAGVGKAVAYVTTAYVNLDYRFVAVAVYCIGMALFTMVMGNGFAAFPVMTGGVGVPILVGVFHGNPATMAAIGMFCGYCGTLMTPMAANFNMVPVALLELPDKNAVIKVQIPTALTMLVVNIFLLNYMMFL